MLLSRWRILVHLLAHPPAEQLAVSWEQMQSCGFEQRSKEDPLS